MLRRNRLFLFYFCILASAINAFCGAQTPGSLSVGGGTLSYEQTVTTGELSCGFDADPKSVSWTHTAFNNFSFAINGVVTPLSGGVSGTFVRGIDTECSTQPPPSYLTDTLTLPSGTPSNISVSTNTLGSSVQVTLGTTVDPYFKVLSILYAAPGNSSSVGFTTGTTNGTTSSVSSNFTDSVATTFSYGFSKVFSAGISFGFSTTTGNTSAFQETITDGVSLNNAAPNSGPNTVNHAEDLFLLWLNPEIVASGSDYSVNIQSLNGTIEPFDALEVFASELQLNAAGATSVTASHLNHQYDSSTSANDLPGMAGMCASVTGANANPTFVAEYANNSCTLADQCGCTMNDFTGITKVDPFLSSNPNVTSNATTATSPESYDTSGALCNSDPQSSDVCRFVEVPCTATSCILSGPSQSGGNHPSNGFVQNDASSTALTFTSSTTESTGYTIKIGLPLGPSLQNTTTFSFTNSQSAGTISGNSNQLQYQLNSNTPGCSQDIIVYEDTVYHTFALQQAPGNNRCP